MAEERDKHLCAYNDHGVMCTRKGTMSATTLGDGPWYCRQHAWVFLHDRNLKELEPKPKTKEQVQKEAKEFCESKGLHTRAQMIAWLKTQPLGRMVVSRMREPGED